jgi:hypothetical protein
MIYIRDLRAEHVGQWVRYRDAHFPEQSEIGRIKSWNDRTVFVVYRCNNEWHRFEDFTAAGTRPESLDFIDPPRCVWEVVAGLIPGQPIAEFTRKWIITSECWEKENEASDEEFRKEHPDGKSTYARFCEEAHEYGRSLTDPRRINWVRVDWIWFSAPQGHKNATNFSFPR